MPTKAITFDFARLNEYFTNERKHLYYADSKKSKEAFLPHSDGAYPADIIDKQRPNEAEVVKEFRQSIWQPITTPKFSQIVSSLGKIRRSSDWSIKYDVKDEEISKIAKGQTLEDYCEINFPFFGSITNWVFSVLMKTYLIDPNAVIMILPLELDIESNEFLRPYPFLFDCADVYDFVPEKYAILRNPEGSPSMRDGQSFYVVTTEKIELWNQVSAKRYSIAAEYTHGLPGLPAFKLGGVIAKSFGRNFLFESRIKGILPNLNESIAEYTDLQAGKRLHVYPERWEYSQHDCGTCKGIGQVPNKDFVAGGDMPAALPCGTCGGRGVLGSSPYSKLLIRPTKAGEQTLPTPPAGFVEKDVEIIKIMDESWRRHIYDALAAINFQFLDQTPLNQSGTAKEVDKEELNNTVHAIAEDIVRIMDETYKHIAYYRYKYLYSADEIKEMLPSISVPDHFDLLSSQFMQEEIGKAKTSKINPVIVNAMEIEFAGKRFINEPEVKDNTELVLKLDPLPNVSDEEKFTRLSNKGITQLVYIITSNIQSFVQRAMEEDAEFSSRPLAEQKNKMKQYAQEQLDEQKKQADEAMQLAQDRMSQDNNNQDFPIDENGVEEDEEEPFLIEQ